MTTDYFYKVDISCKDGTASFANVRSKIIQKGFAQRKILKRPRLRPHIESFIHTLLGTKQIWPETLKEVKSDLHRELIIAEANVQRQVPEEVTEHRILRTA